MKDALLTGLKVLDLSRFEAGPVAAQWLGWYGADVVRIDQPDDLVGEESPLHLTNNNSKRSIIIDLRSAEGQSLVHRLVTKMDVVVENFAMGAAERLGVGYEQLKALNPGLIYCSIKGFGRTGPYRNYLAFDPVAQAAGGGMALTGEAEPMRTGYVVADNISGTTAATGILAAYIRKLRTGEGGLIEVSMQEAVMNMTRSTLFASPAKDAVPRTGNTMTPPTDLYPCKPGGKNDYIQIATLTDKMVANVMTTIGKPELTQDPRFNDRAKRIEYGAELWEEIASWTRQLTKFEAMHKFAANKVPVSAVYEKQDFLTDEHIKAREALVHFDHEQRGQYWIMNSPVRVDGDAHNMQPAPLIGEHTRLYLSDMLELDDAELDSLEAQGTITSHSKD